MDKKIFISFASLDRATAITICKALEARGHACWISCRDIGPGENFQGSIVQAIEDAALMLLVFSNNANNSEEVKKELALASQARLLVIPTRIEDVVPGRDFRYELATRQWIDLFGSWEDAVARLVRQIDHVTPREGAPPTPDRQPSSPGASPAPRVQPTGDTTRERVTPERETPVSATGINAKKAAPPAAAGESAKVPPHAQLRRAEASGGRADSESPPIKGTWANILIILIFAGFAYLAFLACWGRPWAGDVANAMASARNVEKDAQGTLIAVARVQARAEIAARNAEHGAKGYGTIIGKNDDGSLHTKWEGEVAGGKENGVGIRYYYGSNDFYEGEMQNGHLNGLGVYTIAEDKSRLEGQWKNDQLNGLGDFKGRGFKNRIGQWSSEDLINGVVYNVDGTVEIGQQSNGIKAILDATGSVTEEGLYEDGSLAKSAFPF